MPGYMDAIIKRVGQPIFVSGDEYRFYCVLCPTPDRTGHLYVNEEEGFFCHRCNNKGKPPRLLELLGISPEEVKGGMPELDELRRRVILPAKEQESVRSEARQVDLPPQVQEVWTLPAVRDYAISRGLSEFQCNWLGLRAWTDFRNHSRLLFPDSDGNKLVYWTARAVEPGVEPKYESAKGSDKSKCVWNLDRVRPEWPIYICEGNFSAIACGPNGTAIYGKYLSPIQTRLIAEKAGPGGVRIVLDADAADQTFAAIDKFQGQGVPVGAVILPSGEDPDSVDTYWLADRLLRSRPLSLSDVERLRIEVVEC